MESNRNKRVKSSKEIDSLLQKKSPTMVLESPNIRFSRNYDAISLDNNNKPLVTKIANHFFHFIKFPPGLWFIFLCNFLERFSFYGMIYKYIFFKVTYSEYNM